MSKWTIRSRASVITSTIDIQVLMKEQLEPAIKWCIEQDIDFEWEVIHGDSLTPSTYVLSIQSLPWANNLTTLATILEQTDHGSDTNTLQT
jgi:hypothetical protein